MFSLEDHTSTPLEGSGVIDTLSAYCETEIFLEQR
jgi:hypothetical protein